MAARQPIVFGAPDAGAGPPADPAEPGPPAHPAEQDREKHRHRCPRALGLVAAAVPA